MAATMITFIGYESILKKLSFPSEQHFVANFNVTLDKIKILK